MNTTTPRPARLRPRNAVGYCRTCGQRRWHWRGCDEVDRDPAGQEIR